MLQVVPKESCKVALGSKQGLDACLHSQCLALAGFKLAAISPFSRITLLHNVFLSACSNNLPIDIFGLYREVVRHGGFVDNERYDDYNRWTGGINFGGKVHEALICCVMFESLALGPNRHKMSGVRCGSVTAWKGINDTSLITFLRLVGSKGWPLCQLLLFTGHFGRLQRPWMISSSGFALPEHVHTWSRASAVAVCIRQQDLQCPFWRCFACSKCRKGLLCACVCTKCPAPVFWVPTQ